MHRQGNSPMLKKSQLSLFNEKNAAKTLFFNHQLRN